MKNYFYAFVITISSSISLTGQTMDNQEKNKTKFGIKAGLDRTYVFNADNSFDKYNYYAGFFAETRFSLKSSLQYELRYVSYGSDHFVETPILFKYKFAERLSLFAGPRLDFSLDNNEPAKNFSVALEIGLQYDISKHLFFEGAFSYSFENQIATDAFNAGSRQNVRFGLGYKF